MESYKIGGRKIKMPTGWHEVSYNTALKIIENDYDELKILSLLSGESEKDLAKCTDVSTIFYFMRAFLYLERMPETGEIPRSVKLGKDLIILPFISYADEFDLGKAEVGQVKDMQAIATKMSKEFLKGEDRDLTNTEVIKITPFIVAIYLQKLIDGEYDGDKAMKLVKRVKQYLSFKDCVSMGYFFLQRLIALKDGPLNKLQKRNSIRRRLKLAFLDLIQRLVSMLP